LTSHGADVVRDIHQISGAFPIVDERFRATAGFLRKSRQIADAMDMDALLLWITPEVVIDLSHNTRDALRSHLWAQIVHRGGILEESQKDMILRLPIFKRWVVKQAVSGATLGYIFSFPLTSRTSYIALSSATRYFAIPAVPVLPVIKGTCFLEAEDSDKQLLSILDYRPVSIHTFLEAFVLPNINSQPTWLLDSLIALVFSHAAVNDESFKQLETVSFVRVCRKDGSTGERLKPSSVIKKSARIAMLYFSDEAVFGDDIYSTEGSYTNHLELLGMKSGFDSTIADDRIRKYALSTDERLFEKYTLLLEFLNDNESSVNIESQWVPLMKLPAIKRGECVLPVTECRPEAFRPFVEGVLGIVPVHVKPSLQKAFGWEKILEPEVLGLRINEVTSSRSSATIESNLYQILNYIDSIWEKLGNQFDTYIRKVALAISNDTLFPSSSGDLLSRNRLFLEGAHPFEPYLSNVSRSFRNFESILAQLEIDHSPSSQCLVKVITELPREVLTEKEMNMVINILQHLSTVDEFDSSELLLPDIDGQLVPIDLFTQGSSPHAHPRIPRDFAFQYSIPQRDDDLAFLQDIHNDDVFDDYCQEEQISTRISNTLKDYSLWTSFNEFIANAEDCGTATKVSLLLDPENIQFPTSHLFCEELKAWQSPALYVYNDGIFSDADFKAIIDIGRGSKAEDFAKIGKYGLGSLTMYHFTDVPSMISGTEFIMFDPSRKYLPRSRGNQSRRRAGIRIPLSRMKLRYEDHLVPFVGVAGYSLGATLLPLS
jgi:hypothetical protein